MCVLVCGTQCVFRGRNLVNVLYLGLGIDFVWKTVCVVRVFFEDQVPGSLSKNLLFFSPKYHGLDANP